MHIVEAMNTAPCIYSSIGTQKIIGCCLNKSRCRLKIETQLGNMEEQNKDSNYTNIPGVLHPGVLYPGVLHPGVLHPGVLYPGVLHPGVLYPGVLHPGVL